MGRFSWDGQDWADEVAEKQGLGRLGEPELRRPPGSKRPEPDFRAFRKLGNQQQSSSPPADPMSTRSSAPLVT